MSLVAASLMKSAVLGAMPSAELTPIFSAADWANYFCGSATWILAE
jgi:hypothetical protein